MTDTRYIPLGSLLIDIECELRRGGFWQQKPPSAAALNSVEPFAVDTLDFHQWLQFIFLPRMRDLIDTRSTLPMQSNITAMAEVVWADNLHTTAIIAVLRQFDETLNQPSAR
ncbi:MAG: YqcC family protein [Pseudomonadales bacterium]